MRIGIDARMYGSFSTGIGTYTKHCIEELQKIDSENEYVVFLDRGGFSEYEPKHPNFTKVLAPYRHGSISEQILFAKALYAAKLDLMHFTSFHSPLLYRKRSVVTIHDLTLSFYPGQKMVKSRHRLAYRMTILSIAARAKEIITASSHTKRDIVELLGVREEKVRVIHGGIDTKRFSEKLSELEIAQCKEALGIHFKDYILYTGSFREHKNLVRLVEAFFPLSEEFPDLWLVLAGKEDPSYHDVRDTIIRLQLQNRVKLTGFVDDTKYPGLLQGACGYTFPSLYEGFGFPVLEAMASGIPVACSSGSSFREVIGEENALLFSPLNSDDITTKMRTLLSDERVRNKLMENGKRQSAKYSWKESAKQLHDLYMENAPQK